GAKSEYYGYHAFSSYVPTGGTNNVNGNAVPSGIFFGYNGSARGEGSLSAGTLHANYQQYVGYFGTGTFTQTGGSNSAEYVTMGWQPTGNGTYTLSGGILTT